MELSSLAAPAPTPTEITAPFWDASSRREFVLQRCEDCRHWVFYPRRLCPYCWSNRLGFEPASGTGSLSTWSVIHRAGHPGWQPAAPYVIGIVHLHEGPSMLSLILAPESALRQNLPVRVVFTDIGGRTLPCFEPAS